MVVMDVFHFKNNCAATTEIQQYFFSIGVWNKFHDTHHIMINYGCISL